MFCHSAGRTQAGDFENRALVTTFEAMREDATKCWRKFNNEYRHDLHLSQNAVTMTRLRKRTEVHRPKARDDAEDTDVYLSIIQNRAKGWASRSPARSVNLYGRRDVTGIVRYTVLVNSGFHTRKKLS